MQLDKKENETEAGDSRGEGQGPEPVDEDGKAR